MQNIIEKIRNLINDNVITTGRDVFNYESIVSSKIFTLTESNISSSSIVVKKNGTVWASSNYSFDGDTCELTVTGTLAVGDLLLVTYSYYPKYSDTELEGWTKAAISYLSVEKYGTFIIESGNVLDPEPTEAEEHLIAMVASILIKGDVVSYRTPELSITFARGDSIESKIQKFVRAFKKSYGVLIYIDPTISWEEDD